MPRFLILLSVFILYGSLVIGCSNKPTVKIQLKKRASDQLGESLGGGLSPSAAAREANAAAKSEAVGEDHIPHNPGSPLAIEPTPVAGTYLVCLEERTETTASALCRFENEKEERTACPDIWQLTFFELQAEAKTMLNMEDITGLNENFSWKIDLKTSTLAELSLEIYDTQKSQTMLMTPLILDPITMQTSELKDPRKNKNSQPASALRGKSKSQKS